MQSRDIVNTSNTESILKTNELHVILTINLFACLRRALFIMLYALLLSTLFYKQSLADQLKIKSPESLPALNEIITNYFEQSSIVGLAYAIVEEGQIKGVYTLGSHDKNNKRPITNNTLFRVGSISKNVTALTAIALVEKNIVTLDMPVKKILPELPFNNPWVQSNPLKLYHLLEHTGGLPGSSYREYATEATNLSPLLYVQAMSGAFSPRWQPGTFYSYSNPGYTVLGAALSKITDKDFDKLVEEEIFQPLNMTSASFKWDQSILEKLSPSYNFDGSPGGFWKMTIRPAGSMMASINDMAQLILFYANEGENLNTSLKISPKLLKRMRSGKSSLAAKAGYDYVYGLGTFGFFAGGQIFYGHWGKTDGYLANMGYLPKAKRGFVLLSNSSDRSTVSKIREVIAAYLLRDQPQPIKPDTVQISDPTRYDGWYKAFTHDMTQRSWIFSLLSLIRVDANRQELQMRSPWSGFQPVRFTAEKDGFFLSPTSSITSIVFSKTPEGEMTFLGDQQESYIRISSFQAWSTLSIMALALLGFFVGLLYIFFSFFRRFMHGHWSAGIAVAIMTVLAGLFLMALLFSYYQLGLVASFSDIKNLGVISVPSLFLSGLSLIWPLLLCIGIFYLLKLKPQMRPWSFYSFGVFLGSYMCIAIFFLLNGWLPLLSWS